MEQIKKHSDLVARILPGVVIILLAVGYLIYKEKTKNRQLQIISKDMILKHTDINNDSSVTSGSNALKAIETENGRDSLINKIK